MESTLSSDKATVFAVSVTIAVCAVSSFFLCYKRKSRSLKVEDYLPKDGVFTMDSLAKFDGRQLPMYLGVCGKVVDVSSSENFQPDQGYGKLWAGRETTYAMAKVSLKPEDANRLDFSLDDLADNERTALAGWLKHFTTKYPVMGKMKELEAWDFSSIEELAKAQNPFNANKTAASNEDQTSSETG